MWFRGGQARVFSQLKSSHSDTGCSRPMLRDNAQSRSPKLDPLVSYMMNRAPTIGTQPFDYWGVVHGHLGSVEGVTVGMGLR